MMNTGEKEATWEGNLAMLEDAALIGMSMTAGT